ncbi:hypothetical protein [Thermogemmatispora onikobensis]|uniref:hypothetical protein n=1 Tax=Thermogemmatispora onikobensis TaxID=732234 RepID=UPI000852984C|nr:hypothetical protein [Thermogemmatispora onikobensis]
MEDTILYPPQKLASTARTQQKDLHEAWQAHLVQLHQQILQPASQLAAQVSEPFRQHMGTWHQNLERAYAALSAFADLLQGSGARMQDLDTVLSQAFEPSPDGEP